MSAADAAVDRLSNTQPARVNCLTSSSRNRHAPLQNANSRYKRKWKPLRRLKFDGHVSRQPQKKPPPLNPAALQFFTFRFSNFTTDISRRGLVARDLLSCRTLLARATSAKSTCPAHLAEPFLICADRNEKRDTPTTLWGHRQSDRLHVLALVYSVMVRGMKLG